MFFFSWHSINRLDISKGSILIFWASIKRTFHLGIFVDCVNFKRSFKGIFVLISWYSIRKNTACFSRHSIQCFFLKIVYFLRFIEKMNIFVCFSWDSIKQKHRVIFLISWDPIKKHRVIFLISWDPIKKAKGSFMISWDLVHINLIRHFYFSAWLPLLSGIFYPFSSSSSLLREPFCSLLRLPFLVLCHLAGPLPKNARCPHSGPLSRRGPCWTPREGARGRCPWSSGSYGPGELLHPGAARSSRSGKDS